MPLLRDFLKKVTQGFAAFLGVLGGFARE